MCKTSVQPNDAAENAGQRLRRNERTEKRYTLFPRKQTALAVSVCNLRSIQMIRITTDRYCNLDEDN